MYMYVI